MKTKETALDQKSAYKWWIAKSDRELADQLLSTAAYLKENQSYRFRQTALYARLYGNQSLFSFVGSNSYKMDNQTGLPADRPTFNVIQSAADTLLSKVTQSKPSPTFLTDNGDYKERHLAQHLNNFVQGEFYQTKAYEKASIAFRDCLVTGTGILKVYETQDHRVEIERVLCTELLTDANEAMYGTPRSIYQLKLMDREVLKDLVEARYRKVVDVAETAYPDNSSDSSKTISDLVMVVEGFHLPSGKDAKDGRHTIACTSGIVFDEEYKKDKFPYVFMHYSPRLLGFWAQGLAEQLMGTQLEINSILFTISRAIKLVGVPRVFVEEGSKVLNTSFNNDVGTIIKYRGIKPIYEVAPCVPEEMYAQLQRLIDYGFQQCGVSMLQASSQKPAGLNSGEAIRSYDDISTDRFSSINKRFTNLFIDLAYAVTDLAKDIAEEQGSYQTIYPNKDGAKEIDLPKIELLKNPFVIQCFDMSSLPKEPAGRMQKIAEMIQSGMISIREGRRLMDFPDLGQIEKLANASEERIYKFLDKIVEDGEYNPPDSFMDLDLANEIVVQYYNLYSACQLEEERCEMLRNFFSQVQTLKQTAMSAMPPQQPGANPPQANPQPAPTSELLPNAPGAAA